MPRAFASILQLIATSKNGFRREYSPSSGCAGSWLVMSSTKSIGTGSPWMEPLPRHPLVGKKTGPNPTDRAKQGTKRVVITEAHGIPIGVSVAGANCNDFKLTRETLEAILLGRPKPSKSHPQGLCVDKGFDYKEVREVAGEFGFTLHLPAKGKERQKTKRKARAKARRWVVERNHSWLNRFRGILIRWCKKAENYLGMLHLAFAVITWRATGLMG